MHVGVDSANPVTQAAFDRVVGQLGKTPEFWGRYIGGNYDLDASELTVLQANQCRLLVVYNGTGEHVSQLNGTQADGASDAASARAAAVGLNIPAGTTIFADIEITWQVSPDWLTGWISELTSPAAGGTLYTPGIYCAPLGAYIAPAFCALTDTLKSACAIFSAQRSHDGTDDDTYCSIANLPPSFQPEGISCGGSTSVAVIWQFAIHCHNDAYDVDLADDTGFGLMWNLNA